MKLTALRIYPVKSFAGLSLERIVVEPWGFAGDRRWGLIDGSGAKVTARVVHSLLGFSATLAGADAVRITARDGAEIVVPAPRHAERASADYSELESVALAPDWASAWISERVGQQLRLVWQDDPRGRGMEKRHGGLDGENLSLADAGPLLLISQTSLMRLDEWVMTNPANAGFGPLDPIRFRPSVIVDGDEPFAEDTWPSVQIGEVTFRTTMMCDRCVMTTIDPSTLAGGLEPLRTLADHRKHSGKVWFGVRLMPLNTGMLHVGDPVAPLSLP